MIPLSFDLLYLDGDISCAISEETYNSSTKTCNCGSADSCASVGKLCSVCFVFFDSVI